MITQNNSGYPINKTKGMQMNDALLHVNETATRTRLLSNASRTDEISWELEETRAIYRDVQLIPGPAQSGVPITQISSPTRLK